MSQYERHDFPTIWEPPPRISYGEKQPPIAEVVERLTVLNTRAWVRRLFLEKFQLHLESRDDRWGIWNTLDEYEILTHLQLLRKLPECRKLLQSNYAGLNGLIEYKSVSPRTRDEIRQFLEDHGFPPASERDLEIPPAESNPEGKVHKPEAPAKDAAALQWPGGLSPGAATCRCLLEPKLT
jgi:hypothetical protein